MHNPSETLPDLPDLPEDLSEESKTLYLKEALRLSELQLEQQKETFQTTEKKAILLITLYLATIAFFLSWDVNSRIACNGIAISIVAILAIAAFIGVFALFTRNFGIPGANPEYLMQEEFGGNFHKMAKELLKHYEDRIILNEEVNEDKTTYLNISKWIGMLGILLVLMWIAVNLGSCCMHPNSPQTLTQISCAFLHF